jgi:hypothetical protein
MKKSNLRNQSKLLVEHILQKDPISANSVFQKLIMEAEEERENDVMSELGLDDDSEQDQDVDGGSDIDNTFDTDGAENIEGLGSEETEKVVDDIVEINCQINAKMISNLFDKIAELKNQVEQLGLDPNSREYLKYDVSIQYYSDKLQDLQNKTNPGIDQNKVETALDKIKTAIEELSGEVGGGVEDQDITDIDTPAELSAENGLDQPVDQGEPEQSSEEDLSEEQPADEEQSEEESSEDEETSEEEGEPEGSEEKEEQQNIDEIFK